MDLVGVSEGTALIPLKSNDMSGEYARLCGLGLGNSANAKFLKDRIRDIDAYNRNIIKARELLAYIKTMNEFLGDSVVLVSKDSFINCVININYLLDLLNNSPELYLMLI